MFIYHPHAPPSEYINHTLSSLSNLGTNTTITGDLNALTLTGLLFQVPVYTPNILTDTPERVENKPYPADNLPLHSRIHGIILDLILTDTPERVENIRINQSLCKDYTPTTSYSIILSHSPIKTNYRHAAYSTSNFKLQSS